MYTQRRLFVLPPHTPAAFSALLKDFWVLSECFRMGDFGPRLKISVKLVRTNFVGVQWLRSYLYFFEMVYSRENSLCLLWTEVK